VPVVETDPRAVNTVGPVDPLFHLVAPIKSTMDNTTTAHKMLAMCLPERNILRDLRRTLLGPDADIPRTRIETVK